MRLNPQAKALIVILGSVLILLLITVRGYYRDQAGVKRWADRIRDSGDKIHGSVDGIKVGDSYAATRKVLEGAEYELQGDVILVKVPRSADDHGDYVNISGDSFSFDVSNGMVMKISKSRYGLHADLTQGKSYLYYFLIGIGYIPPNQ